MSPPRHQPDPSPPSSASSSASSALAAQVRRSVGEALALANRRGARLVVLELDGAADVAALARLTLAERGFPDVQVTVRTAGRVGSILRLELAPRP